MKYAPLLLFLLALIPGSHVSGEETHYWIYAGQSNLTGFAGLKSVVNQHETDLQLKEIRSGLPGTPIQSWLKDDAWQQRPRTGWKTLVEALKKRGEGRIAGMVWYQGESNTHEDAKQYATHLETVIANVRRLTGSPQLPVIVVQLATCRADNWGWAIVREAQRQVAASDPHVEIVCGLDLAIGDNNVHLSKAAKAEAGRRQGLAALRLVYGMKDITHGPQFSRAFFADEKRETVVLEFTDIQGRLKLAEGWRQGFTAVETAGDVSELPPPSAAAIWPVHAEVINANQVALVFDSPLSRSATIGWGATPSACIGPHRSWDMPIRGLTDETGIAAIAFAFAEIGDRPQSFELPPIKAPAENNTAAFYQAKPFQLAVNGIGRSQLGVLKPGEMAGADEYRQPFWNSVHKGAESYLRDSLGRRTQITVHTSCWYANFSGPSETADQRIMGSYNRDRQTPTRISGLLPDKPFDIVLYHNMPDRPDEAIEYSAGTPLVDKKGRVKGVIAQHKVTLHQPGRSVGGETDYAFSEYIQCTQQNGYTGNYYVFRDIKSDANGEMYISPRSLKKGGRPRFTAMQIIYRGE